jgi:hypothetical protein
MAEGGLLDRLRAGLWSRPDGTLAPWPVGPEAADELERCWKEIEQDRERIRYRDHQIDELSAIIGNRDIEIERLKAAKPDPAPFVANGFRQGYHAAATVFSAITLDLTRMTQPIGHVEPHGHDHG